MSRLFCAAVKVNCSSRKKRHCPITAKIQFWDLLRRSIHAEKEADGEHKPALHWDVCFISALTSKHATQLWIPARHENHQHYSTAINRILLKSKHIPIKNCTDWSPFFGQGIIGVIRSMHTVHKVAQDAVWASNCLSIALFVFSQY